METIALVITPETYHNPDLLRAAAAHQMGVSPAEVTHVEVLRRSLDSRRGIHYHAQVTVYLHDEVYQQPDYHSPYRDCREGRRIIIVGAGPAGLFAALHALELGLKPLIVDRGKPVELRKKDITNLVRQHCVEPDSNWCFGEGGAGTYSDGKLYTRSTKRGDVGAVMRKFVEHGADPGILIDAHAHIGTDRLSPIIAQMRHTIEEHGGEYHFNSRVTDLLLDSKGRVNGVRLADGASIEGAAVILATGHSARDIYQLFHSRHWALQAKPFAIGVRVEHPQRLINQIQYHGRNYSSLLPPAAYSLTTQVANHGVFSFCMCPGGIIVPAATADGEQVVNGMSNASRSSAYANSGIAVTVSPSDLPDFWKWAQKHGEELPNEDDGSPLSLLHLQQAVEHIAFRAAGGALNAPSQRLTDFCEGKRASTLNRSNYMGTCTPVPLTEVLPPFVVDGLRQGFRDFDRKMHGFYTAEASLLAVESRTSSPIRIPRDPVSFQHPQLSGLYPCGEGAGYAGGIVSSALDGIACIDRLAATLN